MSADLNTADFRRIEAALRHLIPTTPRARNKWHPKGLDGFERTLRKIERINETGEYTE